MSSHQPLGIFDSGVGGLSIARAVHRLMPAESLLYIADSRHAPYGDKPLEFILQRALTLTDYLVGQGAKAIVVACNTATLATVHRLREHFALPIIGVEPGVKPAVLGSRSGVVGVLATRATVASPGTRDLIRRFAGERRVLLQPCPGLAERVERLELDSPDTRALVRRYLTPLLAAGVDTLVLGCTHYPFLTPLIADEAGPGVELIDTADAVARQVQRRLLQRGDLNPPGCCASVRLLSSHADPAAQALLRSLWGRHAQVAALDETCCLAPALTAPA
jgi:glutamate racemase